jgi:hypothetical protein
MPHSQRSARLRCYYRRMKAAHIAVLLLSIVAAGRVEAGIIAQFESELSELGGLHYEGTLQIDGKAARFDFAPSRHPMFNPRYTIVSLDGVWMLRVLDHQTRSYFFRAPQLMSGPIATVRVPGELTLLRTDVRSEVTSDRRVVSGQWCRLVRVSIDYTVQSLLAGERMRVTIAVHGELWSAETIPNDALPYGLDHALKTGFIEIDSAVRKIVSAHGLPLEQSVTVTRTFPRSEPNVATLHSRITSLELEATGVEMDLPPDYRLLEPQLRSPEYIEP